MIRLSNSHEFEYMAASGALGFDGKGYLWEKPLIWCGLLDPSLMTVVFKTITLEANWNLADDLTSFARIRLLSGGVVNAMGLKNRGAKWWCREIGPQINSKIAPIAGSILGESDELAQMAEMLNQFDLVALEINGSCPNFDGDFSNIDKIIEGCKRVKEISEFPIILKISVLHSDKIEEIAKKLDGIIEAISINSVPWSRLFPDKESPLHHHGGGGVSGKAAQCLTWPLVEKIVNRTKIPVIAPGIWEPRDIEKLRKLGAKAFSFGSIFLRHPTRPKKYIRKDMK